MVNNTKYYDVLGISTNSDFNEIKKSYRKLLWNITLITQMIVIVKKMKRNLKK